MTEEQKRIASEAIARIVTGSCSDCDVVIGRELKHLAISAAKAMAAGFEALNTATGTADDIVFLSDEAQPIAQGKEAF